MAALDLLRDWPAPAARAAVVRRGDGVVASAGDLTAPGRWASITKLLTTLAVLVAVEERTVALDDDAGPPGATLRHLLAHASGLPFEGREPIAPPGRRRIYSNTGMEVAAAHLAQAAGLPFADYLRDAVLDPLGLGGSNLRGSAAHGIVGPLGDLARFTAELLDPTLVAPATFAEATTVQFPGLRGVLPGVASYATNDWGLGFELRDAKAPHWTAPSASPRTFGHFGGSGSFVWVDPDLGLACCCLTDREFGGWALEVWPAFSDAVLTEFAG